MFDWIDANTTDMGVVSGLVGLFLLAAISEAALAALHRRRSRRARRMHIYDRL